MKENKRPLIAAGVLALLVIVAIVGYFTWVNIAFVDTLHAEVRAESAEVRAVAGGRVERIAVAEGESVAPGDVLMLVLVTDPATQDRVLLPLRTTLGGVVTSIAVDAGDLLTAGQVAAAVWDPESVWIEAKVNEGRVAQVLPGQSVRIRIKQRAVRRTLWGWVTEVGETTLTSAGSGLGGGAIEVPVRIELPADVYSLAPGMSADVRISVTPRIW